MRVASCVDIVREYVVALPFLHGLFFVYRIYILNAVQGSNLSVHIEYGKVLRFRKDTRIAFDIYVVAVRGIVNGERRFKFARIARLYPVDFVLVHRQRVAVLVRRRSKATAKQCAQGRALDYVAVDCREVRYRRFKVVYRRFDVYGEYVHDFFAVYLVAYGNFRLARNTTARYRFRRRVVGDIFATARNFNGRF